MIKNQEELLSVVRSKKAFVPGCGEGHDVVYLAAKGYQATGVDISPTAVEVCRKHAQKAGSSAHFMLANFFADSLDEPYDLIFDYSFLCAILPEQRNEWGRRMAELIRPGGLLVTLMFPLDPSLMTGPPFSLSVEIYHQLLDPAFDVVFEDSDPPSAPDRVGREQLAVWRRR